MTRCLRLPLTLPLLFLAPGALAQDAPRPLDCTGTWSTTFGALRLHQAGKTVTGDYRPGGPASLRGTLEGRRLTFRYVEPAVEGEGWFEFSADGARFQGKWREDGQEEWGEWKGTRRETRARGPFDGLFETKVGRVRLLQGSGPQVKGFYLYEGRPGRIAGTAGGRRLEFSWQEGEASKGTGEFTLSEDGQRIDGSWTAGEGAPTPWGGERLAPRPNVVWLMVLEAQWEESLADREYSFGKMLREFLRRYPHVEVRHRRFGDRPDFVRATREVALLAEPVVLVVASHGKDCHLLAGQDRIPTREVGELLAGAPNLELVHFSSCEMLLGDAAEQFQGALGGRRLPVSGYAVSVDWSASALLEFLYLDLVLGRRLTPSQAVKVVRSELRFSGDEATPGSPLGASKFRFSE